MTSAIAAPDRDPAKHGPLAALAIIAAVVLYTQLQAIGDFVTFRLLGLSAETRLGSSVAFFVFELPKVLLLLTGVVFIVGVLRSFVSPQRARQLLGGRAVEDLTKMVAEPWAANAAGRAGPAGRHEASGNVLAALLGVATPFCSCSAVPLFIGFVTAGVPLGVTFSFLIAAPMVNEVALVLLFGLFGWKVAAIYLGSGLGIAIVAGWILGRLKLERHVEPWVWAIQSIRAVDAGKHWPERIAEGRAAMREIVGKVWLYVVIGIAVGAGIHGYVPTDFMTSFMGRDVWWAVPLAVLLGVPMYANAAAIIPVVQALLGKGAALGTVLAFMMSVIALSFPEMVILRKVLRPRLIAIFIAIVAAGILCVGYLFNAIL